MDSEFSAVKDTVDVMCDDANAALKRYVDAVDWSSTRALVFLDPYGLEVDWGLVQELAATGACDVWYLFPLGGVMRMMKNDGQLPDTWVARLDRLFGTPDWHDKFYQPNPQQPLLDIGYDVLQKCASTLHVVDYVRGRLESVFAGVSKVGVLCNNKRAPLFALVLGVSNPSGAAQTAALAIANHLVKDLSKP